MSVPDPTTLTRPESPCIGVCILGDDDGCLGCRRTSLEITLWTRMTPAQQWAVVEDLPRRSAPGADEGA